MQPEGVQRRSNSVREEGAEQRRTTGEKNGRDGEKLMLVWLLEGQTSEVNQSKPVQDVP